MEIGEKLEAAPPRDRNTLSPDTDGISLDTTYSGIRACEERLEGCRNLRKKPFAERSQHFSAWIIVERYFRQIVIELRYGDPCILPLTNAGAAAFELWNFQCRLVGARRRSRMASKIRFA